MAGPDPGKGATLSRRTLLRKAGAVGIAAAVPPVVLSSPAAAAPAAPVHYEAYTTLTPSEADILNALLDRFVPNDAVGPGAVELGVGQFIDRALGGALKVNHDAYSNGLATIDAYAQKTYGTPFTSTSADKQDAIITQMQANTLSGFSPDSRTFFNLVKEHVLQGLFGDPYWGGNKNGGGWKLMQIPGIGLDIKAADQQLGKTTYVSQYKNSAYEWDEFKKRK